MADDTVTAWTQWAEKFGTLNAKIVKSYGIGLQAPADENDPLVAVPNELILDERTISDMAATDKKFGKWLKLQNSYGRHKLHRELVYLAVFQPGEWMGYTKLLPSANDISLPFSWREDEVEQLDGTSIYEATVAKRKYLEHQFLEFSQEASAMLEPGQELSLQLWLLAYQWLSSRSLTHPATGESCLVPIIDLANHSDKPNVRYEYEKDQGMVLVATGPLKEGEELFLDYGERSSAEFLFNYGFVPDRTNAGELVRIYDPMDEAIRGILDPSRDPDCPPDLKESMAGAYELLVRYLQAPRQSLKLRNDKHWADEFITLVACEDLAELKLTDGAYGLYIGDDELIPGSINEVTMRHPEISERGDELVAKLCEHFKTKLPKDPSLAVIRALASQEAALYDLFMSGSA